MKKWSRYLITGILFLTGTACPGQQVELKFMEFKGGRMELNYSLNDSVAGKFYTVRLYSSRDNFLNPLEQVVGDAGLEISPGGEKKIIWDPVGELGNAFEGKISFEVRARLFVPFINTESINQYKVFRRKRSYQLTWSGGTPQNVLNFDLYHGDEKVWTNPNLANVGNCVLELPSYIRAGKNYRLMISDAKNKEEVVFTAPFRVKRKVPLLVKAIPLAAIGFVAFSLSQKTEVVDNRIGDPIPPPDQSL